MSNVALTFDDGPDPVFTPRLLDLLAHAGATATFFPIAPLAEQQPDLVQRMVTEGHTVGLHCDEHVRHSKRDRDWGQADTARALKRLGALGVSATLWRTPWGDMADWTAAVARERGMKLVGWTVDTNDWRGHSADAMFAATHHRLVPGAIVLAHDGIGPGAERTDAAQTLAYAKLAIEHARRGGLTLRALETLT